MEQYNNEECKACKAARMKKEREEQDEAERKMGGLRVSK